MILILVRKQSFLFYYMIVLKDKAERIVIDRTTVLVVEIEHTSTRRIIKVTATTEPWIVRVNEIGVP